MTTAADTIARSERTAITHRIEYFPVLMFTADIVLAGTEFEYVFQGERDKPNDAVAVGRIRRFDTNDYRATLACGRVVAEHATRRKALCAIVRAITPGAQL